MGYIIRILASSTQTTASGLSKTTHYNTNYTFNANNTLLSIENTTSTNGSTTTILRDYKQNTSIHTSAEGRVTTSTFDPITQDILTLQSENLKPITYIYDTQGKVLQTTQGNRTTSYTYDTKGKLQSLTDPKGQTTSYSYDLRDRVTQTTYADGTGESYEYDANSNLVTRTIPTPTNHTFTYNGVNKKISTNSPLQKQTIYTYDKQRRITNITKPSAKTIDTTYTNGRVTAVNTTEGTTHYNYSCQNNLDTITKENESLSFIYDGTLLTSITQVGELNQALSFGYNNDFLVSNFTYAGQSQSTLYNKDNEVLQTGAFLITRNTQDYNHSISDGSYTKDITINGFGEVQHFKDNNFEINLTRDKNAKIIKKIETLNNKSTTYTYTYDQRGRILTVNKEDKRVESYTYDNNGNRASATLTKNIPILLTFYEDYPIFGIKQENQTTTASYTLDDNLIVYGDNTYLYDEDGYLEEKTTPQGTTTYSYGTLGELQEVITPTQTISYQHNANNQRVAKRINGEITEKYLWANLTTLLAIYDNNDNLKQRFEYANQRMPVAMTTTDNTKYYLHYDQVGSLRAISDTNHNIIKEITYDTFGNILSNSNPSFKIPFGFAGGLYDLDTQLTRFGYRDYDAETGKWTAKDPIGFGGGDSNLYGYVNHNPVNFIDPTGLLVDIYYNTSTGRILVIDRDPGASILA